MNQEFLPIGSIVLLKGARRKIMIFGYTPKYEDKNYDYIGVVYPEGFIGNDIGNVLFNKDDINDVVFKGYLNPESQDLIAQLEEAAKNQEQ